MVVKRIVYDLDNTLIPWKDEYNDAISKTFDELNYCYTEDDVKTFIDGINNYEKYNRTYSKELYIKFMESRLNRKLPDGFMDLWLTHLGNCVPDEMDLDLVETLEVLSHQYEQVVFTNFFTDSQAKRLDNAGILKYFDAVIGADMTLIKPNYDGFILTCGIHNPEECVMVGDDMITDIIGAASIDMHTILLDSKDRYSSYRGNKIKTIGELRKIL